MNNNSSPPSKSLATSFVERSRFSRYPVTTSSLSLSSYRSKRSLVDPTIAIAIATRSGKPNNNRKKQNSNVILSLATLAMLDASTSSSHHHRLGFVFAVADDSASVIVERELARADQILDGFKEYDDISRRNSEHTLATMQVDTSSRFEEANDDEEWEMLNLESHTIENDPMLSSWIIE